MSKASGVRAGAAFVEIGAKDAFTKGLDAAQKRLKEFGASVKEVGVKLGALGVAITAPLVAAAHHFAEAGDALDKMSKRTGLSVAALQELGFAAEQAGTNMEGLEKALAQMSKFLFLVQTGNSQAAGTLKLLGIEFKDLKGLAPDALFERIGEALSKVADPTARAALAMRIFGRGGREILPLLGEIKELREQWRATGLAMSKADTELAARLDDTWKLMKRAVDAVIDRIGAALAPLLIQSANRVTAWAAEVGRLINNHRGLVASIYKIGVAATVAGAAVVALGVAFVGLSKAFGILSGIVTLLGAIASPAVLATVAIASLTAAMVTSTDQGGKAILSLENTFESLKTTAIETWKGIVDALAAGDLEAAGKVAVAGLRVAWLEGIDDIRSAWIELTTGIESAWVLVTSAIERIWVNLWSSLQGAFRAVTDWIAKRLVDIQSRFDSTVDATTAKQAIDQQAKDDSAARAAETIKKLSDIDKGVLDDLAEIGKDQNKRLEGAAKDLEDAHKALDEARQRAAIAAAAATAQGPTAPETPEAPVEIGPGLGDQIKSKFSSFGTFNLSAAFGLAGGPLQDLTKKADEQVRLLRDIRDNTLDGGTFE